MSCFLPLTCIGACLSSCSFLSFTFGLRLSLSLVLLPMHSTFKPQNQPLLLVHLVLAPMSCTFIVHVVMHLLYHQSLLFCIFCVHILASCPLPSLASLYCSFLLQFLILYLHISCTSNLMRTIISPVMRHVPFIPMTLICNVLVSCNFVEYGNFKYGHFELLVQL